MRRVLKNYIIIIKNDNMTILSIYSEDFLKIQKTIKKIKPDPARYYLHQARILFQSNTKFSIQFTDGFIAIDTFFDCVVDTNSCFEKGFELELSFDSFRLISVKKGGLVNLIKKDDKYFFEYENQKVTCSQIDGLLPEISKITSPLQKNPKEFCLNLKKLSKFIDLSEDVVFQAQNKNEVIVLRKTNGDKIGVIMPVCY